MAVIQGQLKVPCPECWDYDLVYDEETGTVVSRKRRKTSRQVPEWEKDTEW